MVDPTRDAEPLPRRPFLQGGGSGKAPRPVSGPAWLESALENWRA